MRQQGDLIRTMYPKLILEGSSATFGGGGARSTLGGAGAGQDGTTQLSASVAALKRPPLARAVHLTLGKDKMLTEVTVQPSHFGLYAWRENGHQDDSNGTPQQPISKF